MDPAAAQAMLAKMSPGELLLLCPMYAYRVVGDAWEED